MQRPYTGMNAPMYIPPGYQGQPFQPPSDPAREMELRNRRPTQTPVDNSGRSKFSGGLINYEAERTPLRLKGVLNFKDFINPLVWKATFIEFVASITLFFIAYMTPVALVPAGWARPALSVGFFGGLVVLLYIYAFAAGTGGHLNPMITLSTMVAGLTSFPRGLLYMIAHVTGAIVAGAFAKIVLPKERPLRAIAFTQCAVGDHISNGEAFLFEVLFFLALLLIAFGVALDPNQGKIYGPVWAPIFIGVLLGFLSFVSGSIFPGYTGAAMNPARCTGAAVWFEGNYETRVELWVFWLGDITACVIFGIVYWLVPPSFQSAGKEAKKEISDESS
eukprot:NODE_2642_length_1129_cov_254.839321_g2520_i0.p1 GENE.NODE_2642_length_1129_cov_254.839321_g2520_i0~~NODE_2642_length_1129_cov_254.839321_g2520_i0.p1  ORF type:complete len:351 (+),score=85.57 NODE_2642_length_1129_cov_254.839321_g2520_i0:55-1053(+)